MKYTRFFATLLLIYMIFSAPVDSLGQTDGEIQNEIQAKSERLKLLNSEIQATQNTLNEVQKQKSSLQQEVKTLDTSVRQLNLKMQTDEVTSQKLTLEMRILDGDLAAIAESIESKRNSIGQLLRALQKNDNQGLALILLSRRSLTDLLRDIHSIDNLRTQLSIDIRKLSDLSEEQGQKLGQMSSKQREVALRLTNLANRKEIVEDQKIQRASILEETKNQESIYQDKISKLKAEQDALEDEIERIENSLKKNFNTDLLPTERGGILSWPLQTVRITQHFGEVSRLYRGKPHNGLDLGVPVGTAVFAAADGEVVAVDNNDQSTWRKYQYGKYIIIRHGNNLSTLYAHLSRQVAFKGQQVKRGDLIGYSGNTGYSTGPHLHLGLYWAPSITFKSIPPAAGLVPVGVTLDPESYL